MKYIFDFDDVLFDNTVSFKKRMYLCLEDIGIPYDIAFKYYIEVRENGFSLKNFISILIAREKISGVDEEELYEKMVSENKNFVNTKLIEIIKKLGKANCYMVTNGQEEYQSDKIARTGITPLFSQVFIVQGSKRETIEKICAKHKDEKIVFIDDRADRLEDLDFKKCPNLKTILYTGQELILT